MFYRSLISSVVLAPMLACIGSEPEVRDDATTTSVGGTGTGSEAGASAQQPSSGTDTAEAPFELVPPRVYASKIKSLLVGKSADDAEISAIASDPSSLRSMVNSWLNSPEANVTFLDFFATAFQQKNLQPDWFGDQLGGMSCGPWWGIPRSIGFVNNNDRFIKIFSESFGRTAWQLAMVEKQPFTSVLTTRRFMMTSTMLSSYLFMDRFRLGFDRTPDMNTPGIGGCLPHGYPDIYSNLYKNEVLKSSVTTAGPISISQTLDPNSPNFMRWGLSNNQYLANTPFPQPLAGPDAIYYLLNGYVYNEDPLFFYAFIDAQWQDSDFSDWRMVEITQAAASDRPIRFYDLPLMRSTTSVALSTPRVGFFSTPAFFANWQSNQSNQFRVTANQAMIVALGRSFLDNSAPLSSFASSVQSASDAAHASNAACAGCHNSLDPLRHFYTSSYSYTYQGVTDQPTTQTNGHYLIDGQNAQGRGLDALGKFFAASPSFAGAWVKKVCEWANSSGCDLADPQMQALAARFVASNFDFRSMVVDVLTSALVTGAASSATWQQQGEPLSIARQQQMCSRLQARLGLPLPCALSDVARQNASNIPGDNYMRGFSDMYLPQTPTLYFRSAIENLCIELAPKVVDGPGSKLLSATPDASLQLLVTQVMGVNTGDLRYQDLLDAVGDHYNDSMASGAAAALALKSSFVAACLSPSSIAVGL